MDYMRRVLSRTWKLDEMDELDVQLEEMWPLDKTVKLMVFKNLTDLMRTADERRQELKEMLHKKRELKEIQRLLGNVVGLERLKERYSMPTALGFKFQPNDQEIISLLQDKHCHPCQTPSDDSPIKDFPNLYGTQPEHLPGANRIKEKEPHFCYVRTRKKSGNGDRKGPEGFWKAIAHKEILSETGSHIGDRRTLKYLKFPDDKNHISSKNGKATDWMMHEYRLATTSSQSQEESFEHWTICKVFWKGKNIKVPNDFSREGSIGPLEIMVQQNSSSMDGLVQKCLGNNELKMDIQNAGDQKVPKIVDSKQEESAQTNCHSIGDEFGESTQENRGKFKKQRMNREIHQSDEATPCYASEIHSTPSIMVTTHGVETAGVEPQQFENPGKITKEFGTPMGDEFGESTQENRGKFKEQRMNREIYQSGEETLCYASEIHSTPSIMVTTQEKETGEVEPQQFENPGKIAKGFGPSISQQTSASLNDLFHPDFIGWEENQSRFDPSILEQTSVSWGDCLLNLDFIESEDENQPRFSPSSCYRHDWNGR